LNTIARRTATDNSQTSDIKLLLTQREGPFLDLTIACVERHIGSGYGPCLLHPGTELTVCEGV
jgi:hypothetical protein